MRGVFENLGSLVGYYEFIRCDLEREGTPMPKSEVDSIHRINGSHITRSAMEEKYAFVGDVRLFFQHYSQICKARGDYTRIPLDALELIFEADSCKAIARFKSFGELAIHFNKRYARAGDIPRRLCHKQHLSDIATDMWNKAEPFFVGKGFIVKPVRENRHTEKAAVTNL